MRKAIMQELLTEYEAQRQRNQAEELRRRQEVEMACPEIAQALDHTLVFALDVEHMTGKLVNEA